MPAPYLLDGWNRLWYQRGIETYADGRETTLSAVPTSIYAVSDILRFGRLCFILRDQFLGELDSKITEIVVIRLCSLEALESLFPGSCCTD